MEYFVGDLHIGDGSGTDNFKVNAGKFRRFIQMAKDTGGVLYLVGDTYELWQSDFESIFETYRFLCSYLMSQKIVRGNHDSILKVPDRLITHNTLIIHGHQFDKYNKNNRSLGKWITRVYGIIEPYCKLDVIDKLWRDNEKYLEPLAKLAKQQDCDTVIFGHTHLTLDEYKDGTHFLNAGSWIEEHCHYIKYDDGVYTLNEWSG